MTIREQLDERHPHRSTADVVATSILLPTVWPTKFESWTDSQFWCADGFEFHAIRQALADGADGPWVGCSSGERRALDLACLVAEGGQLAECLQGIDDEPLQAFLGGMTTQITGQIAAIESFKDRMRVVEPDTDE